MNKQDLFIFNSSNKLFNEVAKLGIVLLLLMFFFWRYITPEYLYSYNASLIDKMNRLENCDDPKIVLIGHSNLSFGIRSELIENAFDMKVVNMGLHGGLGNAFHEEMAKVNVNPGDIIILCHSNYSGDETISDPVLAWTTVENHFDLWRCIPIREWYHMILEFPTYAKKCIALYLSDEGNMDMGGCYSRFAFNEYGDDIYSAIQDEHFTFDAEYKSEVPPVDEICTKRLNCLNKYITDRGATLLIGGYPIAYGEKKPNDIEFEDFRSNLQSKLNFPIISDYRDYFYPYEDFYNTTLHLTNDAAIERTNQLIEDLKKYLNK